MPSVLCAPLLTEHGFSHGFSTRQGGASRTPFDSLNLGTSVGDDPASVIENQRRFARAVGYAPEQLFELDQVHGRTVRVVRAGASPERMRREQGDGLIATDGACVGMRTADCVPVLLADPLTRTVAALHAGWRGTVAGVIRAGVELLCEVSSAAPTRLIAAVFPHIRVCCFEVGEEVADALTGVARGSEVVRRDRPKPHAALAPVIRSQLLAAGIVAERVDDVPGCTCCEPERFYSYRRDGAASGRHLAAIVAG